MAEAVMVLNDVTRQGLRRLHVMGSKVDVDPLIQEHVPADAIDDVEVRRVPEKEMGVEHVWLTWHAREMVFLKELTNEYQMNGKGAALWWVGPNGSPYATVSFAADLAAELYWLRTGRRPEKVLIRKAPEGKDQVPVGINVDGELEPLVLQLVEADWVPNRFVVVM